MLFPLLLLLMQNKLTRNLMLLWRTVTIVPDRNWRTNKDEENELTYWVGLHRQFFYFSNLSDANPRTKFLCNKETIKIYLIFLFTLFYMYKSSQAFIYFTLLHYKITLFIVFKLKIDFNFKICNCLFLILKLLYFAHIYWFNTTIY